MSRNDFTEYFPAVDKTLEYYDDEHIYLVDGVIVPSVTQLMHASFPDKYADIDEKRLQAAAERGNAIHSVIERAISLGDFRPLTDELRGFAFLMKHYRFVPMESEMPILYCDGDGKPVYAGRMDLLLRQDDGSLAIADIKSTSVLDREYLRVQLNLYRLAYEQNHPDTITALKGIHLRGTTRKYADIPISDDAAKDAIAKYKGDKKE